MGVPAYISVNRIDGNATITASAADTVFSVANIFDEDVSKVFRFTSISGGNLEFDLGSATTFNTIAIFRHNFAPAVGVVIKAGFGANPSTVIQSGVTYQADNLVALFSSVQSARFVRVEIDDARGSGVSEFGQLKISPRVLLPRGFRFGHRPGIQQELIQERTNRGKAWVLELFTLRRREYQFKFPRSELSSFETLHSAVQGPIKPFGWIEDVATAQILYVRKEAGFDLQEDRTPAASAVFTYTLQLTEESPGAEILE